MKRLGEILYQLAVCCSISHTLGWCTPDWHYGGGKAGCRIGVDCWPQKDWQWQEQAAHKWMAQARALAPSLNSPLTLPVPTLRLANFTTLRPNVIFGRDIYSPRFALFREECASPSLKAEPSLPHSNRVCLHIVICNVMTHSPLTFTLELGGIWSRLSSLGTTRPIASATRIFEVQYELPISEGGQLTDMLDAGASNVYEIGCEGQRPNSSTAWPACSNRRGKCTQGWVNKPSGLCGDD